MVLATRPRDAAGKYLGYNYALIPFAPYGPYWREVRKLATIELLSKTRLDMLSHVRINEVDTCIKHLYSLWAAKGTHPVKMEMSEWFRDLVFNVVTKMIAGKRYFGVIDDGEDEIVARRFQKAINKFSSLSRLFNISDVLPYLEWLDLQGNIKAMKSTGKELDFLIGSWVEEHCQKRVSGKAKSEAELDFIDVMLSIFPEDEPVVLGIDRSTFIKAISLVCLLE